jgi:hypothetical protein
VPVSGIDYEKISSGTFKCVNSVGRLVRGCGMAELFDLPGAGVFYMDVSDGRCWYSTRKGRNESSQAAPSLIGIPIMHENRLEIPVRHINTPSSSEGHSIRPTPWSHPVITTRKKPRTSLPSPSFPSCCISTPGQPAGWLHRRRSLPIIPRSNPIPRNHALSAGRPASYQYCTVYIERRLETSDSGAAAASARYSEC